MVNVLGAALLVDEDVLYGDRAGVVPRIAYHFGETFVTVPGVADPFTAPPKVVGGRQNLTRRWVHWRGEGQTTDEVIERLHQDFPRTARDLLALHRRLRPDEASLRELEATLGH